MMMKPSVALLLLFASLQTHAESPPSPDLIQHWWAKCSTEKFDITQGPLEVRLRNKEIAYLIAVEFLDRGRNFSYRSVLIRPSLQEALEVDHPISTAHVVYDLDQDGVSEVVTQESASGQGQMNGSQSIVQLDGWTPVILFQRDFYSNSGLWEDTYRFYETSVDWQFVDLDKDGKLDLVEVTTVKNGRSNRPPVVETIRRKFMFKNNAFIKYVDYKKQLTR